MADIVVSNLGEAELLRSAFFMSAADPSSRLVHLFDNDYTPTRDIDLTSVVEPALPGYAPVTIDPANWSDPVTVDGQAVTFYTPNPVTFFVTSGSEFVYGFFVTNAAGTVLLWAARFDSPQLLTPTQPAAVSLSFGSRSQSEPL